MPKHPIRSWLQRGAQLLSVSAVTVLVACAGQPTMPGALGNAAAPPRAWSQAMEQRRAQLAQALASAGAEVLRTPDNALLLRWAADRAFAGDTADPSPAAAVVWDRVAAALASGPAWRARVQGHSDASTTDNDGAAALAAQRALSLRNALVQRGLPSAAMDVEAWGARAPLLPNDTPEGRAGNRRVEIWVTD